MEPTLTPLPWCPALSSATASRDFADYETRAVAFGFACSGLAFDTRYNFGSLLYVGLRVGGTGQFGLVSAERQDGSQLFETHWLGGYAIAELGMHIEPWPP